VALDQPPGQAVRRRLLQRPAHLLPLIPEAAAERFGLGAIVAEPARHHGGVNRLWRVRTTAGEFAVHAMHGGASIADRLDRVLVVEQAAAAGGVALATPVPDPQSGRAAALLDGVDEPVVVHHWVDATNAHLDRSPPDLYRRLGRSVALVHGLDVPPPSAGDERLLDEDGWRELAAAARRQRLPWADDLAAGAAELAGAADHLKAWRRDAGDPIVVGHRDLTSMNVLDLAGTPVLIDWEDAGRIGAGDELGRTALDNLGRDGVFDEGLLRTFLAGYAEVRPLPPVGPHWCGLWTLGLVVFAEHCARSCLEGTADESLLRLQSEVVAWVVPELRRRLEAVPRYVAVFEKASRSSS
jgi:Ser/Thr protein kinase RdoA (MazF antagonist)